MELVSLVYFSRNRTPAAAAPADDEIVRILAVSVANNKRDNITGGLVYDGTWFAQVLEGDRTDVMTSFERIKTDPRHSDITLVGMFPIARRRFPYWWMGGAGWDLATAALFAASHQRDRFDPRDIAAEALVAFIAAVIASQATRTIVMDASYASGTFEPQAGMR